MIGIIPARIGSKRIKRKNIKPFLGIPVLQRTIDNLLESDLFDELIISTDSNEIAKIAVNAGAKFYCLRPTELSDDYCGTLPVIKHEIKKNNKINDNTIVGCVYPTSCLFRASTLQEAYKTFCQKNPEILFSALKFSHPIQRAISKSGELLFPKEFFSRTQDFEDYFHDAGQFYIGYANVFMRRLEILGDGAIPYEMDPLETQDIDNENDWRLAEMKYKSIHDA